MYTVVGGWGALLSSSDLSRSHSFAYLAPCDLGFSVLPEGISASLGFFASSDAGFTPAAVMVVSSPGSGSDYDAQSWPPSGQAG